MLGLDELAERVMQGAFIIAARMMSRYITPEHLLLSAVDSSVFAKTVEICGGNIRKLKEDLTDYIDDVLPKRREDEEFDVGNDLSASFKSTIEMAVDAARSLNAPAVELSHIIWGISRQNDCFAGYFLSSEVGDLDDFCSALSLTTEGADAGNGDESSMDDAENFVRDYADVLNETALYKEDLIGREKELDRIVRILLRKEKNNPLLIGEPGVGKTAVVTGLAKKINAGDVPDGLKDTRIFSLDLTALLAGTQYRGDFEMRFKDLMDAFSDLDDVIVFIDEIHNIIGAGNMGSGAMDAAGLMKPYLDEGRIRFIGTSTYDEYKRYIRKNTAFSRRFQNVDIKEPDEEETVRILEGLRSSYEKFHGVRYAKDVLPYAVKLSKTYIGGRFLPDKAIDLLDEAGAYRRMHPLEGQKKQSVGKDVIETVLAETGGIPKATAEQSEVDRLKDLYSRITSKIFGQDEAVHKICDAILMSRAGLVADNKPIASFLFVGPTGVGKTEVAKVLANELGIGFIRFDMSEYMEKHTVSKLIGSPAGYVGYEDGGQLTDAIRKTPHCVLLLDEIEKAHPDIFNILLQVMDYASLTDSHGLKADFKNVIIIMTSNAGARLIGRQSIGFGAAAFNDGIMMEEVKRLFSPEFRNRLSAIVSFSHMSEKMAGQITDKKIRELMEKLNARNVDLKVDTKAAGYIKKKGITREYGAREIERVIDSQIKPLFVSEILFGGLKKGGKATLTLLTDKDEKGRVSQKPFLKVDGRSGGRTGTKRKKEQKEE